MPGCRAIQALYEAIAVPPGNQRTSLSKCQNAKSDLSDICPQGGGAAGSTMRQRMFASEATLWCGRVSVVRGRG